MRCDRRNASKFQKLTGNKGFRQVEWMYVDDLIWFEFADGGAHKDRLEIKRLFAFERYYPWYSIYFELGFRGGVSDWNPFLKP